MADLSLKLEKLDTDVRTSASDEEAHPQSVIHAPEHFQQFSTPTPHTKTGSISSPSDRSAHTTVSPALLDQRETPSTPVVTVADHLKSDLKAARRDSATSPLKTDLPAAPAADRSTPQAQTIQEAEEEYQKRKSSSGNLAGIPESSDGDRQVADHTETVSTTEAPQVVVIGECEHNQQVHSLRMALNECWTLCNTLANLSSNHRNRIFAHRGQSSMQEQAWRSCWRLCQNLYENQAEDYAGLILPTLEMCREFCQALFDARLKGDEISDSVLRVSFELNNHLYNTHDRNLPSAFQERTLDFYVTLCHRLMKQRTSLPPETDNLLRACWTLAEMLFSIRQNSRQSRGEDEELLSSAVQACWDLCDLFREGWTQVRPTTGTERGTPRPPHQPITSLSPTGDSIQSNSLFSSTSSRSVTRSSSAYSQGPLNGEPKPLPPETPTTIFDDTTESPLDGDESNVPNILVLGPEQAGARSNHHRWTDSASTLSGYTESSQRTSSTATAPAQSSATAANLTRVRVLLLRAAFTAGFQLRSPSQAPTGSPIVGSSASTIAAKSTPLVATSPPALSQQNDALIAFVRTLSATAFGAAPWQQGIVDNYRRFVLAWPRIIRSSVSSTAIMTAEGTPLKASKNGDDMTRVAAHVIVSPAAQTHTNAQEIASAVRWMCRKPSNNWLIDLHRAVFGSGAEDASATTREIVA
ncbi:MAG: hypothetical protein Q9159_006639 [Coniocarpon cinnabarinum]